MAETNKDPIIRVFERKDFRENLIVGIPPVLVSNRIDVHIPAVTVPVRIDRPNYVRSAIIATIH